MLHSCASKGASHLPKMFHEVSADEDAGPPQASLAMNGKTPGLSLCNLEPLQ